MAERILYLAHTDPGASLSMIAREALSAAMSLDGELSVGLIGVGSGAATQSVGACGAVQFLVIDDAGVDQPRYSTDAAAVEALYRAAQPTIIVAPQTSRFARVMAGVAQRLNGRVDTHVCSIVSAADGLSVTRWFYRQRLEARLTRAQRPWLILVEGGCAPAFQGESRRVDFQRVPLAVDPALTRTQVIGRQTPKAEQQTIRPDAKLLFVAGAGWTKKQADGKIHVQEAAGLISDFLNGSQASLGSSKSLVDIAGEGHAVLPFLSHLNQVGQTGATPRHPKGLAACCHGEEPHVVGWRFIRERRAINLDPNCGWARGKADVLYVADAFAVIERVNALLRARSSPARP
ncbi:MAG TPA: electron transfer flavoprotein subunit alpha [Bryobacteraceae bacterium]|nr:electron transfer flavoprotein subunit alpha [Bryobacteraceae bacterium]